MQEKQEKTMGLSNGQEFANETNSSNYGEQLMEKTPIAGTDFDLVGNIERGYWIAFGRFRMTEARENKEEALQDLIINQWKITTKVSAVVHETLMADTAKMLEDRAKQIKEINKQPD